MAEEWTIPLEKPVTAYEQVEPAIKQLGLIIPTPNRAGVVAAIIGARDENQNFREDVKDIDWRIEDDLTTDPPDRRAAFFVDMIFRSVVPSTPETQALGIAGLTVLDAGTQIVRSSFSPQGSGEGG